MSFGHLHAVQRNDLVCDIMMHCCSIVCVAAFFSLLKLFVSMSTGLTSLSPAKTANLVEFVWKQR